MSTSSTPSSTSPSVCSGLTSNQRSTPPRGRCDALVETDEYVYVFEFKVDSTAAAALAQITERGYLAPYADDPREQVAVGVNFSTATRQVDDWSTNVSSPPH